MDIEQSTIESIDYTGYGYTLDDLSFIFPRPFWKRKRTKQKNKKKRVKKTLLDRHTHTHTHSERDRDQCSAAAAAKSALYYSFMNESQLGWVVGGFWSVGFSEPISALFCLLSSTLSAYRTTSTTWKNLFVSSE